MTKVYVVTGAKVKAYNLIKETKLSFIIEHSGGVKGKYTQPKLRTFVKFRGEYVDVISTTNLQLAKAHAKATCEKLIKRFDLITENLSIELKDSLSLNE